MNDYRTRLHSSPPRPIHFEWTYNDKYTVKLHRSYEWIDPTNPCTLVIPGAAGVDPILFQSELFGWFNAFNDHHQRSDGLYDDGHIVHGKFYVFTPTSYALAIHLALQTPTAFAPPKLCYDINTGNLRSKQQRDRTGNRGRRSDEGDVQMAQMKSRIENVEEQGRGILGFMLDTTKAIGDNMMTQVN